MTADQQPQRFRDQGEVAIGSDATKLGEYLEEMYKRLPEHADRAATIPPREIGSAEWFVATGLWWREQRVAQRVHTTNVAPQVGLGINGFLSFELGLGRISEVEGERSILPGLATALGSPDLYGQYQEKLLSPDWANSVNPRIFEQYTPKIEPSRLAQGMRQIVSAIGRIARVGR
jgi:hypothetical protein